MKKRVVISKVLVLVLLLAVCMAGCGKSVATETSSLTDDQSEESTAETDTQAETEKSQEKAEGSAEDVQEDAQLGTEDTSANVVLKEIYAGHNMKVGTCLSAQMIKIPQMSKLICEQFNSITMENSMKPDYIFNKQKSIEAGDLVVEFNKDTIEMLDWAKENDMAVRGHTLVWYSQTPDWIFYEDFDTQKDFVSRDVMLARMESYIRQVFEKLTESGYAELFYAYDVVNEAWMEDGLLRENHWSEIIGDDYLWYAFYYADQYAPETIDLYYNDYNEQFKTATLVKFVETLVDEDGNFLIDGIGLQGHLYTMDDLNQYFRMVDTLGKTGLKIEVTELDVSLGKWQNTLEATDDNLKVQGRFYYSLIQGLFERVDAGSINMDSLTFWGVSDSYSWRKNANPLLYDAACQPKYAYFGAAQIKEMAGFDE